MDAIVYELYTPPDHDYCNNGVGYDQPSRYHGFPLRGQVHFRHSGGFNAVFVDGHARWLRRTTYDMWSRQPETASRDHRGRPCWKFW